MVVGTTIGFITLIAAATLPCIAGAQPGPGALPPKKEYYPNGDLKKEVVVEMKTGGKSTVTTSRTKEYYEGGGLRLEETEVVTGPWPRKVKLIEYREYYPGGKLKEKGVLRDVVSRTTHDYRRGKIVKYNPEGRPVDIAVYRRGKCKT